MLSNSNTSDRHVTEQSPGNSQDLSAITGPHGSIDLRHPTCEATYANPLSLAPHNLFPMKAQYKQTSHNDKQSKRLAILVDATTQRMPRCAFHPNPSYIDYYRPLIGWGAHLNSHSAQGH
ncbi:hypothetical protein KIL84_002949 [Mauremys mutica]|uniref:Uncharacterized protein n=1 Tax=Mauremys mutica TaxID=74926 RepID=A0A9D3WT52_9SAUR|nr:hypothetical protein KIL84_002949 [Mauremys mutica]